MSQAVLSVRDLHVNYGAIEAVKGISFEILPGEIVSLIGANGAGKTTTLRALSGLQSWRGEVFFQGQSLTQVPGYQIVGRGLVQSPEGRGIFLNLTVAENLRLGAYQRSLTSAQWAVELEEFCFALFPRLQERLHASAGTLSGGEQQMLALSRALLSKPKLLILDEPSLGLAPRMVQQIFHVLQKLNAKGLPLLLVDRMHAWP